MVLPPPEGSVCFLENDKILFETIVIGQLGKAPALGAHAPSSKPPLIPIPSNKNRATPLMMKISSAPVFL
jgi:hypothetical protein